ncbi:MAG: PDZ domain-containing protein [Candidatus Aminicenantaceae bacterium]
MNKKCKSLWTLFVFLTGMGASTLAASPSGAAQDLESLTKKVFPSVVRVEARDGWRKVATGVVIDKEGYIVTTALVSSRDNNLFVISSEGEEVEAEFLGMDPETHLALIKAKDKQWKPIAMGRLGDLSAGSEIAVVCFSPEEKAAITKGIISSVGRDSLRLNVVVIPGASGSPVIDMQGRMIGLVRGAYVGEAVLALDGREVTAGNFMVSRVEGSSSGMASAIPLDIVNKVSTEIRETGKVRRGWMGVDLIVNDKGEVEVYAVTEDSPAEDAGVQEGDVLLAIDGQEIIDREMLAQEIRMHTPGDEVELRVKRKNQEQEIGIELGEYSQLAIAREFEFEFPQLFQMKPGEIPENFFKAAPSRLLNWVSEDRKFIGVLIQQMNPELAEFFGVDDGVGLLITKVEEDTPAEKAGLKVGDVIVRADGKVTKSGDHFTGLIQDLEEGDKVKLEVVRDKKTRTIEVEVAVEEGRRRWFLPEAYSNTSARLLQEYENRANARQRFAEEALKKQAETHRLYQEGLNVNHEWLEQERTQRSLQRASEIRKLEEYRKQNFEKQKEATKRLKIALERYRCIKV